MKLTYIEAITHVRKYKKFIRVGAIADDLGINQGQFRQIINRVAYAKELPEKYRADFIQVVTELTSVRQVEQYEGDRTISDAIDLFYQSREDVD